MGRMSVGEYLARPREAGVRYADVAGMGEAEVEALLFRRPSLWFCARCRIGQRSRRSCASPQ
jgi:hypothetical protein